MKYPTNVTLEVSTVCNVIPPCVMCAKHTDPRSGWLNNDAAHFPLDLIPKLRGLLANAEVLSLYGIGEPLTCPYLFDFKNYTAPDCHVQFTSNGWLLNEANTDRILNSRVATLDISLDATTPHTYARIRHGDFEETVSKISKFIAERNRRGSLFPGVILNMCLMLENIRDLPGLPALMKRTGVNHCYAFHLNTGMAWKYDWFDYARQHCSLEPELHDALVAETYANAQSLGVSFELKGTPFFKLVRTPPKFTVHLPSPKLRPSSPVSPSACCLLPWNQVIVYKDGSVSNCCWQDNFVGNLYQDSFEDIWNGARQQAVREALLAGKFSSLCSGKLVCPPRGRP